ncbi:hypothetical protein MCRY_04165 [Marivita cryptomonadis]|nr:hypothetical protein MCRY_04165 [Marivita cryptomonadis]
MPTDWFEVLGIHALYASHVHAVFLCIGSALVMPVDSAYLAEIVFRCVCAKGVECQAICAFDDIQIIPVNTGGRGPPAAAIGTITAPRIFKAVF